MPVVNIMYVTSLQRWWLDEFLPPLFLLLLPFEIINGLVERMSIDAPRPYFKRKETEKETGGILVNYDENNG